MHQPLIGSWLSDFENPWAEEREDSERMSLTKLWVA
jgi:hypothetical protein